MKIFPNMHFHLFLFIYIYFLLFPFTSIYFHIFPPSLVSTLPLLVTPSAISLSTKNKKTRNMGLYIVSGKLLEKVENHIKYCDVNKSTTSIFIKKIMKQSFVTFRITIQRKKKWIVSSFSFVIVVEFFGITCCMHINIFLCFFIA